MWQQDPNDRPEFEAIIPRLRKILEDVEKQEAQARESPPETTTRGQQDQPKNNKKSWFWCCF